MISIINKIKITVIPILLMINFDVQSADNININITGKVIASPCTIDNSGTYNVDFGKNVSASTLATSGSSSAWKAINITLSNCPAGTTKVTAVFSGTSDAEDNNLYANAVGSAYAKRVAIQLQDQSGTNVGNGTSLTENVSTDRIVTFPLQARLYTVNGGATPGTISSQVLFNVTYN